MRISLSKELSVSAANPKTGRSAHVKQPGEAQPNPKKGCEADRYS